MTHVAPRTLYIKEFELELALEGGETKEFEYEYDGVTPRAEVEYRQGDQKLEWEGQQALDEVLALFALLEIRGDANPLEVAGKALRVLEVKWEQVRSLELELAFSDGRELEFEWRAAR